MLKIKICYFGETEKILCVLTLGSLVIKSFISDSYIKAYNDMLDYCKKYDICLNDCLFDLELLK